MKIQQIYENLEFDLDLKLLLWTLGRIMIVVYFRTLGRIMIVDYFRTLGRIMIVVYFRTRIFKLRLLYFPLFGLM